MSAIRSETWPYREYRVQLWVNSVPLFAQVHLALDGRVTKYLRDWCSSSSSSRSGASFSTVRSSSPVYIVFRRQRRAPECGASDWTPGIWRNGAFEIRVSRGSVNDVRLPKRWPAAAAAADWQWSVMFRSATVTRGKFRMFSCKRAVNTLVVVRWPSLTTTFFVALTGTCYRNGNVRVRHGLLLPGKTRH